MPTICCAQLEMVQSEIFLIFSFSKVKLCQLHIIVQNDIHKCVWALSEKRPNFHQENKTVDQKELRISRLPSWLVVFLPANIISSIISSICWSCATGETAATLASFYRWHSKSHWIQINWYSASIPHCLPAFVKLWHGFLLSHDYGRWVIWL